MNTAIQTADPEAQTATQKIGQILAWLETPRAERPSDELASQLLHLQALAACAAPPQQRSAALQAFYQRAHTTVATILPRLSATPPPLPRRHKVVLRAAQETLLTLARALLDSLDVVNTYLVRGLGQPPEHILGQALHTLNQHYLLSALAAAPAGRDLWRELHRTFATAQNLNLGEQSPTPGGQTLRDAYFATVLLAGALPASLNAREVAFVANYLAQAHDLVDPPDEVLPVFLIEPTRDSPASAASRSIPAKEGPAPLTFSCKRLCARLRVQETALASGIAPSQLDLPDYAGTLAGRDLLRRLAERWSSPPKRRFPRRRQGYRGQIVCGLDALVALFKAPEDAPQPSAQWMVINESPDGYAVMHISGDIGPLAVGDIAALRSESGAHWQVCAIRWAQSAHPEHFEIGLQILASSATPALLSCPAQGEPAAPHAVLILPAIPPLRDSETLIAPSAALPDTPCRFILLIEQHNVEIREMRSIGLDERNEHFAAFRIAADEPELPAPDTLSESAPATPPPAPQAE